MHKVPTGPHSSKWVEDPIDKVERRVINFKWWFIIWAPELWILLGILFLGACLYYGYRYFTQPTFTLNKSEWSCTDHVTGMLPITQMVGKSAIVTFMPTSECVNYRRNY